MRGSETKLLLITKEISSAKKKQLWPPATAKFTEGDGCSKPLLLQRRSLYLCLFLSLSLSKNTPTKKVPNLKTTTAYVLRASKCWWRNSWKKSTLEERAITSAYRDRHTPEQEEEGTARARGREREREPLYTYGYVCMYVMHIYRNTDMYKQLILHYLFFELCVPLPPTPHPPPPFPTQPPNLFFKKLYS